MTKPEPIEGELVESEYRAGDSRRIAPGSLDNHYIEAYLQNPFKSQQHALQVAAKSAGIEFVATRQRAYEIHDRLRDKIDAALIKKAKNAKAMGLETLIKLCESAESESVFWINSRYNLVLNYLKSS